VVLEAEEAMSERRVVAIDLIRRDCNKMPLGGASATTVVSFSTMTSGAPSAIAVDVTNVYWGGGQESAIYSAPKAQ
jgi:hypothetical protein